MTRELRERLVNKTLIIKRTITSLLVMIFKSLYFTEHF